MARRSAAGFWMLVALAVLVSPAAGTPSRELKLQLGGQWLLGDTGLVPPDVPGSKARAGGLLAGLSALRCGPGRWAVGAAVTLEGNQVDVGPAFPATGTQVFGIATLRALALAECRLRGKSARWRDTEPYVLAGLGWNWHWVGTKVTWVGSTPEGAAVDLQLHHTPAVLLGLGVHQRVTRAGLYLNAECGWKLDTGDFRMAVAGGPDRTGRFDLSGLYLLVGLTLRTDFLDSEPGSK